MDVGALHGCQNVASLNAHRTFLTRLNIFVQVIQLWSCRKTIWLKTSDHHHLTTQEILSVVELPSFALCASILMFS